MFRKVTLPLLLIVGRAAADRVVRLQLQQLQQHLPADRRRPAVRETRPIAGDTDILISYTYKLAFESGKGQDYGLASAVSIIIFLVVAGIAGDRVLADQGTGEHAMTTVEQVETAAAVDASDARAGRKRRRRSGAERGGATSSRSIACLVALFPIAYVISAAFNADQSLGGASLIPRDLTLDNFRRALHGHRPSGRAHADTKTHYVALVRELDDRRDCRPRSSP